MKNRRAILGLGALALGYVAVTKGGPALWSRLGPLPEFSTEGMPAGFRKRVGATDVTAGLANPLIGIDDGTPTQSADALDDAALCRALFDNVLPDHVPVNYFTDYNCPYCRVALAARAQSAYDLMHERLNTGVVRITENYIDALAAEFGLDAKQLLSDMSAPEVGAALSRSKGAANRFGVIGTPFLLIGRTAIYGRIDPIMLERVFRDEASSKATYACPA